METAYGNSKADVQHRGDLPSLFAVFELKFVRVAAAGCLITFRSTI